MVVVSKEEKKEGEIREKLNKQSICLICSLLFIPASLQFHICYIIPDVVW